MHSQQPYNPLDKRSLAESIARVILASPVRPLSDTADLKGAGVYAIYYTGDQEWYASIAKENKNDAFAQPIYVGKAIPKGGRKGGLTADASKGVALRDRLGQHRESISQARNLKLTDFHYRCLVVDDIWIPLGENMLIEEFKPVWNLVIDGFGNKDPGKRRSKQYQSAWDVIHPGREFAKKLAPNPKTADMIISDLKSFYKTGAVPKKGEGAAEVENDDEDET